MAKETQKMVFHKRLTYGKGKVIPANTIFEAKAEDVEELKKIGCKEVKKGDVAVGEDGKQTPVGGGAGSGSADAAADLKKLDLRELFKLANDKGLKPNMKATKEELIKLLSK